MQALEILTILFCIAVVGGVLGNYIYKRVKHLPTGECSSCQSRMKKNIKKIKKELAKERADSISK